MSVSIPISLSRWYHPITSLPWQSPINLPFLFIMLEVTSSRMMSWQTYFHKNNWMIPPQLATKKKHAKITSFGNKMEVHIN